MVSFSLYLKSLIVGTPLESSAKRLRWLLGAGQRVKHPELWELYLEERRLLLILQRILSEQSCGVDVGCHIGSFLSLLMKYAPKGRHIAFEPSVRRSELLRRHFPAATIYACAVSDRSGTALFQENSSRPGYSHLQADEKEQTANAVSYEVETRCLDNLLLETDRLDLIKLDIEGGELAALHGAAKVIRKFRPTIIFECGSEYDLNDKMLSRRDLYNFITKDLDYSVLTFGDFPFDKGSMTFDEFRKCGLYPFKAFNFVAVPAGSIPRTS